MYNNVQNVDGNKSSNCIICYKNMFSILTSICQNVCGSGGIVWNP